MKIAVYNENTTRAGKWVDEETIDRYNFEHGSDCWDWTVYEGTPEELAQLADLYEQHAGPFAAGSFDRKTVRAIREALSCYRG